MLDYGFQDDVSIVEGPECEIKIIMNGDKSIFGWKRWSGPYTRISLRKTT
jgi:hypothetical protein